ncbi:MAG: hypothetical protein WCK82_10435, partial [Bacteroidota bacterium]
MHANKTKGWRVLGLKSEYDVKQYILKLNINPDTLYLSGSVTIIFEITGTKPLINFDAHLADPLKVDSVISVPRGPAPPPATPRPFAG